MKVKKRIVYNSKFMNRMMENASSDALSGSGSYYDAPEARVSDYSNVNLDHWAKDGDTFAVDPDVTDTTVNTTPDVGNPADKSLRPKRLEEYKYVVSPWDGKIYDMGRIVTLINDVYSQIGYYWPVLEELLHQLPIVFAFNRDIKTMATDGKRIYVNPGFVEELRSRAGYLGVVFVIIHELFHVLFYHTEWLKVEGKYGDGLRRNYAMDYEINLAIEKMSEHFKDIPEKIFALKSDKYAGYLWQQIYDMLDEDPNWKKVTEQRDPSKKTGDPQGGGDQQGGDQQGGPQPGAQPGNQSGGQSERGQGGKRPGDGSGSGNSATDPYNAPMQGGGVGQGGQGQSGQGSQGQGGGGSAPGDLAPTGDVISENSGDKIAEDAGHDTSKATTSADARRRRESTIRERADEVRTLMAGTGMEGVIEEILYSAKPKVDWAKALREFMISTYKRRDEWSPHVKSRIHRRDYRGREDDRTPPPKNAIRKIAILADSSGSVSKRMLEVYMSEIHDACIKSNVEWVDFAFFSDGIGEVHSIKREDLKKVVKVDVTGGTNFDRAFKELAAHYGDPSIKGTPVKAGKPDLLFILTDGGDDIPAEPPTFLSNPNKTVLWLITADKHSIDSSLVQQFEPLSLPYGKSIIVDADDYEYDINKKK